MGEAMSRLKTAFGLLVVGMIVTGCVNGVTVSRDATSNFDSSAFFDAAGNTSAAEQTQTNIATLVRERGWRIADVQVDVPRSLTTSEANTIKPNVELLWQDEPRGDRYAQVRTILERPLRGLLPEFSGDRDVVLQLRVIRFHAQTPRVRNMFGGAHELEFTFALYDANTGALVYGPAYRDLTFTAYGGRNAVEAEARGLTQRVRIEGRFHDWMISEFQLAAAPSGLTF